ncbi:MAG: TlpA family protein disulfide reductase [Candidatus Rokubacteria bacterium]|nr:TlpA family protein disulfide reductase [Candidatus Rokubacteria bacterium]
MTRSISLVAVVALVAGTIGVVVYARRSAHVESGAAPASPPFVGAPSASDAATTPAASPTPRTGRTFTLDDAVRELDLVKPSRVKAAQDFTLPLASGKKFRLAEHRGKVVFINFWATWCPPCREEMPAMERLYREHRDAGFVMVAVSLDADAKVVPPFLSQHPFTFPVALDPKMEVANAYGVRGLPSSFIVDARGNLTALALGPRKWDNDASHSLVERMAPAAGAQK